MFFHVGTHTTTAGKVALGVGMACGFLFGGWSELLTALLVLNGLDIILGLMTANKSRCLSSNIMYLGIKKKLGMWVALIFANVIDIVLFKGQGTAITGLLFAFISYEGLSIIESLAYLGVPIPDSLKESVENMSKKKIFLKSKRQEHLPLR